MRLTVSVWVQKVQAHDGGRPELQGVQAQEPALEQTLEAEQLRVHVYPVHRAGGTAPAPPASQCARVGLGQRQVHSSSDLTQEPR